LDFRRAQEELDWVPEITFWEGLKDTVQWYTDNREWWEFIKSGAYKQYYETQYGSLKRGTQ